MDSSLAKYLPLTESTTYILLALTEPLHGYALMQKVDAMSQGTVKIGPGTLYGAFAQLEKEGLIEMVKEADRRKSYALNSQGEVGASGTHPQDRDPGNERTIHLRNTLTGGRDDHN